MKSLPRLRAIAMLPLFGLSVACAHTNIETNVPACERLIPQGLIEDTPPADIPEARQLPDGHDDAQPWQAGFIEQTGQLQIANAKSPAVDHIYRECLSMHREALKKSRKKFLGLF